MLKKLVALLLSAAMLFSLTACRKSNPSSKVVSGGGVSVDMGKFQEMNQGK